MIERLEDNKEKEGSRERIEKRERYKFEEKEGLRDLTLEEFPRSGPAM